MKKMIGKIGQSIRRVVLYLRLSKEDLAKISEEDRSESIKNQESMLRTYAEERGWEIVGVYDDEDYSGADRDRPNFNRMIKECENGNVDIVLVKTQSRFARDMPLVDEYVHNKFKKWGVQFITYVEGIDNTKKETKKTSQITAMTDEWYLEDTSENIRKTLREKKANGLCTLSFVPYGYVRDPDSKNHLLIDIVAAAVVKKIFDLYKNGWGCQKIANYLNSERIPSPLNYKRQNGYKIGSPFDKLLSSITRKGEYVVTNTIKNCSKERVTNVISIGILTASNCLGKSIENNVKIFIRSVDSKIKLFSSSMDCDISNLKSINFKDDNNWKKLQNQDVISPSTKYIVAVVDELPPKGEINFELNVEIMSNNEKLEYHYISETMSDNNQEVFCISKYVKKPLWSEKTVGAILRNEMYIGNMVQGKYRNVSYKDHTSIYLPEEEWIIVENTHEAIIDKETWYAVQNRILSKSRVQSSGTINPLSRKVYCSCCGKSFQKSNNGKDKYEYLVCRDRRTNWSNCDNRSFVRLDMLEERILTEINTFIEKFRDENLLKNFHNELVDKELFKNQIVALKKEKQSNDKELETKEKYFQQLYEDRLNQVITNKQFISLSQRYNEDIKKIEERQKAIEIELETISVKQAKLKNVEELFSKYKKVDKLTLEIANEWIDKIYIGLYDKDNNTRDIKIVWNF